MVRQIIFDDEITLWWEYDGKAFSYDTFLDGKAGERVNSTHVSFRNLTAEREYAIKIVADYGAVVFDGKIRTGKKKRTIDVTKAPYFAVGDGKTPNTAALQRALNDCSEGGRVYLPAGTFLSGALRLKSDTELYLDRGCVLQGADRLEEYLPKIKSRFEGVELTCYSSLLNAGELDSQGGANCRNIVIRGGGRIVGGGNSLREKTIAFENARLKKEIEALGDKIKDYETADTIAGRFRGRLVNVSNADGVIIGNIGIENSPAWNLHMVYSQNLTVYDCKIRSHGISNGDGIDPDSVENCAIFGCEFDTGDDCIAIKSGRNPEGNLVNRRSANIYIFDCLASGNGVSVGSEMSGGVENVYVWDCDMLKAYWGIQLKFSKKRGGFIRNVHVNRCKTSYVAVWSVWYNNDGEGAPTVPEVRDLFIEDCLIFRDESIYEDVVRYVFIRGIDEEHPVKNIYFNNVTFKKADPIGGTIVVENAENVVFNKVFKTDA